MLLVESCLCAVYKQGQALKPRKTAQHHAWRFDDGSYIEIIWELYKPGLGNTIEVETGATMNEAPNEPGSERLLGTVEANNT